MLNKIGVNACVLRPSLNLSQHIDVEQDRGRRLCFGALSESLAAHSCSFLMVTFEPAADFCSRVWRALLLTLSLGCFRLRIPAFPTQLFLTQGGYQVRVWRLGIRACTVSAVSAKSHSLCLTAPMLTCSERDVGHEDESGEVAHQHHLTWAASGQMHDHPRTNEIAALLWKARKIGTA